MALLALLPEIFKEIMHYLISEAGVAEAWKLPTFYQEISENALSIQPRAASYNPLAYRVLVRKESLKFYLAYHLKKPGDILPQIPAKIQKMADYLKEELEEVAYKHQNVLMNLCGGFSQTLIFLNRTLWDPLAPVASTVANDGFRYEPLEYQLLLDGNLTYCDKTIAAMSVQAYDLIEYLLTEVSGWPSNQPLRTPMAVAVGLNDLKAIETFMDCLKISSSKRYMKRKASSRSSVFGIPPAIQVALDLDRHTLLSSLLNELNSFAKSFNQSCYRGWIRQAVLEGKFECLQALVSQVPVKNSFRVTVDTIEKVCKSGNAEMMTAILENGCMPIDNDTTSESPLAIAICHGYTAVVGAVLDAGADINISMIVNHTLGVNYDTPLGCAIRLRKYGAVSYLVERWAKVRRVNREALLPKMRSVFDEAVRKRKADH